MGGFNWRSLSFWLPIALSVVLLLFVPRGCTLTIEQGQVGARGTPSINIVVEKSGLLAETGLGKKLRERYFSKLFSERYTKQDWFFFVDYKYEIDAYLSGLPQGEAVSVSVTLPGRIVSTNADSKTGSVANWALALGKDYEMKVVSRYIRWWLIAALVLAFIISLGTHLYVLYSSRKTKIN